MDGLLLQSAEGLEDGPISGTSGEIWEWLQREKEALTHDVTEAPLGQTAVGFKGDRSSGGKLASN